MANGIAEIVGLFLVVVGICLIVGAAAVISTALALGVAGSFVLLVGVVVVYVANAMTTRRAPVRRGDV